MGSVRLVGKSGEEREPTFQQETQQILCKTSHITFLLSYLQQRGRAGTRIKPRSIDTWSALNATVFFLLLPLPILSPSPTALDPTVRRSPHLMSLSMPSLTLASPD